MIMNSTAPTSAPGRPDRAARVARARARARARGFTLIELTVALVGGLLVGLAVVGLSKEATNTFHEDMRAAQAQFSLRTAIDRVRSDLSRAGFMGSPNIWGDPRLVTPDYVTKSLAAAGCPLGIKRLSGLRLFVGGSMLKANVAGFPTPTTDGTDETSPYSANNNLRPDAMDISGNMNTVDAYTVQTTSSANQCGTIRLALAVENPPAYRLLGTSDAGISDAVATLKRSFIPVDNKFFIVRLQDASGHVQYVEACGAGITAGTPPQPWVDITANVPLLTTNAGGGTAKSTAGGESGFFSGSQLNPVLTVRYKLSPPVAIYSDLAPDAGGADSRFDLYRFYIDSKGEEVGTPDLIAEYAVDLKFAFTVDNTASNAPNAPLPSRTQLTFPFDDTTGGNGNYGSNAGMAPTNVGPQRIRSVRVRLATRTAFADRQALVAPPTWTPNDYKNLFRYCVTSSAAPCGGYARVRTVITEVAMNNLATAAYP
jgi:type II secretory pathway pseudopilin PulG